MRSRSRGQRWVHSCCSSEALAAALADDNVTAIETDIVLSTVTGQPVMAHPPATHSDLSFEAFVSSCLLSKAVKHLKLDFKAPAVVLPCLELLARHKDDLEARGQGVWLNADVLPGPGVDDALFDADHFVRTCCERLPQAVLSLGWRVDLGVGGPYTCKHVDDMLALVRRHHLDNVVLAANLRLTLLAGSPNPLTRIFRDSKCELSVCRRRATSHAVFLQAPLDRHGRARRRPSRRRRLHCRARCQEERGPARLRPQGRVLAVGCPRRLGRLSPLPPLLADFRVVF